MEDRLRKLAQVVEYGGFSKAAVALHVSQPALTTAVKKLERELGVLLLDRRTRKIALTTAGELAYQSAKELDTQTYNLKQHLAILAQARPIVRIGMIDSVADTLAAETNGFAGLKQAVDLSVVVDNSSQLTLSVVKETLEAAIVVGAAEDLPRGIIARSLGVEPLILVVHPTALHSYQQALRAGRLPNFLSYNSGSHTQRLVNGILRKKAIAAEPSFYSTSPEIMLKMVLLRQGAAILPYAMVKRYLLENDITPVIPQPAAFSRPICAIQYRGRLLSPALLQTFTTANAALKKLMMEAKRITTA